MARYNKCPECRSENIKSMMVKYSSEVGCLCGFMPSSLDPYVCEDCGHRFENWLPLEPSFPQVCWWDNPNCPVYSKKGEL